MITLSTCTADQTSSIAHIPVDGSANAQESEKRENSGEFARIFANLLRRTVTAQDEINQGSPAQNGAFLPGDAEVKQLEKELFDAVFSEEELQLFFGSTLPLNRHDNQEIIDEGGLVKGSLGGEILHFLASRENAENTKLSPLPSEKKESVHLSKEALLGASLANAAGDAAITGAEKKAGHEEFIKANSGLGQENDVKTAIARETGEGRHGEIRPNEELVGLNRNGQEGQPKEDKRLEGRDRRRERLAIDVRDYRTENAAVQKNSEMRFLAGLDTKQGESAAREITLELRMPAQAQNAPISEASGNWEAKASRGFEDFLAKELHQKFNGDIVRHAVIALKNNGASLIKLALKPESLGNVKISLEMAENKITGRIIVESEEALRAFRREIQSLEQAFRDSGFDIAKLDLSLASEGKGEQHTGEPDANPFQNGQIAALHHGIGESFEQNQVDAIYGQETSSINVLV